MSAPPAPIGAITSSDDEPFRALEVGAKTVAYAGVIANITGNPAMSVPLWWDLDGLPIGVHFLGRYGDEATLFRLAAQLETARPWAHHRPPVNATQPRAPASPQKTSNANPPRRARSHADDHDRAEPLDQR